MRTVVSHKGTKGRHKDAKEEVFLVPLCLHFVPLCERKGNKMKSKRLSILLTTLLLASFVVVGQQALEPSAEKLQQHISYLASDALDGRRTGTAGANDAARYVAGEFSRAGLMPGAGKAARKPRAIIASYLQTFPYVDRKSV